MTPSQITNLRGLLAKATPGPWEVDGEPHNQIIWSSPVDRVCFMAHSGGKDISRDVATANLIAAMRAALPSLLDAAERVERLREGIKSALHCTPFIRCDGSGSHCEVDYDCGDPWELLRALLTETADGGASDVRG